VGAYQAAKRTVELVDTLIEKVDEHNARKRDTDASERDHRDAITFGSPNWKP
jgi:hypothetical protein